METGWLVYGNTFIYDENIKDCDEEFNIFGKTKIAADVSTVRTVTLVLICYGYLQFLAVLGLICFALVAWQGYKSYKK